MAHYTVARLITARRDAGLDLGQAAALAGIDTATLRLFESGTVVPASRRLHRLAEVYGVGPLYDSADPTDPVTEFGAGMAALIDAAPPFSDTMRADLRAILVGG